MQRCFVQSNALYNPIERVPVVVTGDQGVFISISYLPLMRMVMEKYWVLELVELAGEELEEWQQQQED